MVLTKPTALMQFRCCGLLTVSPQLGKLRVSGACSQADLQRSGFDAWRAVGWFPGVPHGSPHDLARVWHASKNQAAVDAPEVVKEITRSRQALVVVSKHRHIVNGQIVDHVSQNSAREPYLCSRNTL